MVLLIKALIIARSLLYRLSFAFLSRLIYDQLHHSSSSLKNSPRIEGRTMLCHVLLKCTSDWYLNLEGGKYTAATFVDLKKAIDTVNHKIL